MGIRLAIDDFGTGYSSSRRSSGSRSNHQDRPLLHQDIPQDPDDVAITQAIIAMAHSLRLKVIAEAWRPEQLDFLTSTGATSSRDTFSQAAAGGGLLKLLRDNAGTIALAAAG